MAQLGAQGTIRKWSQTARRVVIRLKLPCLLLIQPAISWVLLLDSSGEPHYRSWIGPIGNILALVVGVGLLYPIVVSITADRLRNDARRMLAVFRPGLFLSAGLGAAVLLLESAALAASVMVDLGRDAWLLAGAVALGGIWSVLILLCSGIGRRLNATQISHSVLVDLAHHPELEERLRGICADLKTELPTNVLVGMTPEFFCTSETVTCWDGEMDGGVLYLPLPTCRLLTRDEFDATVAAQLLLIKGERGDVQLEFRERVAAAVDAAQDVDDAKNDWSWFSPEMWHPIWLVLRLGVISFVRMCIVLGAEWFAFFVSAFQRVVAESRHAHYYQAMTTAARLYGAQWYVSALEKEAALSLCAHYQLVGENGATHRLGEVLLHLEPSLVMRPTRPSPWVNPFVAWRSVSNQGALFGVSMDWCHRLAMDVNPDPNAASLFTDVEALQERIAQADQKEFLPEDKRTRKKRLESRLLRI